MEKEVAASFADIERQAAELIAGFATMEGRNSSSALAMSARRDSEESRRGNSTPSSAGSERVRSPELDGAGQGAFFSPPVSAGVDQRSLIFEQLQRLNTDRAASDVRTKREGVKDPPPAQGSADRETKKVLKKLADKWSRYADSFGYCSRCGKEVIDADMGCEALGKVYHSSCFKCSTCGSSLVGQTFYNVKDTIYCEKDYLDMLDKCYKCQNPIQDKVIRALGEVFHPDCFVCCVCQQPLDGVPFTVDARSELHCVKDFNSKYAPKCGTCGEAIAPNDSSQEENFRIVAMGKSFHPQCYKCEDCDKNLTQHGEGCYPLDNHLLCRDCNSERIQAMTSTLL